MTLFKRLVLLPVLAASIVSAACEGNTTLPTEDPLTQSVEVYTGPLDVLGTNTYLFTLPRATAVQAMFAGALLENPLRSTDPMLTLKFGVWDGNGCVVVQEFDTTPKMTAVLHRYFEPGSYCLLVTDKGSLTEPVGIVVRLVAPPLLSTGGSAGTDQFSTTITPGGTATRSFEVTQNGTARVTLTSLAPDAVEMGLAIGVIAADGTGCKLTRIATVTPGAGQISATMDAGDYCARVFDIGNLKSVSTFSLSIEHP